MLREVQLKDTEMLQPVCSVNIGWLHVMIFRESIVQQVSEGIFREEIFREGILRRNLCDVLMRVYVPCLSAAYLGGGNASGGNA